MTRRICGSDGTAVCWAIGIAFSIAFSALPADDRQNSARPNRLSAQDERRIGSRDATGNLGAELLAEDFRIRDRRIVDMRYLPKENAQLRQELRLKAEKYIPAEGTLRETLVEEKPAATAAQETKKRKAETLFQF